MIEPDDELRIRGIGGFKGQVFRIKVAREGLQNINEEVGGLEVMCPASLYW